MPLSRDQAVGAGGGERGRACGVQGWLRQRPPRRTGSSHSMNLLISLRNSTLPQNRQLDILIIAIVNHKLTISWGI